MRYFYKILPEFLCNALTPLKLLTLHSYHTNSQEDVEYRDINVLKCESRVEH